MDYDFFAEMETGALAKAPEETEQAFMERILREVFARVTPEMAGRINDKLCPKFAGCSAEEKSLSVSFAVDDWMLNPSGNLHGGILGTAIDMTMGVLARYLKQTKKLVTVQLSIQYLRGICNKDHFTIRAIADHVGRRSVALRAEIVLDETNKLAATATSLFM